MKNKISFYKLGKCVGFLFSILITFNLLYFILVLTKKITLEFKTYFYFLSLIAVIYISYIIFQFFRKQKHFSFIKGVVDGFRDFPLFINQIFNSILLTFLYFLGVGPISLLMKLKKKKMLMTNKENKESYWLDYNLGKQNEENYYRQF